MIAIELTCKCQNVRMISPLPGMGVSPLKSLAFIRISSHHIPSITISWDHPAFVSRQTTAVSITPKVFQLLMWVTPKVFLKGISHVEYAQPPFPPFNQLTVSIEARARPLCRHQSISQHQPQIVTQIWDGHIFRTVTMSQMMSQACHRGSYL